MPPKKRLIKKPARGAKKQFVASMPSDMPVADVVAKAAVQGIELNNHQVSNIRWNVKSERKSLKQLPKGPKLRTATRTITITKPPSVPPKPPVVNGNGHPSASVLLAKEQLRTLAVQIGLIETRLLIAEMEESLGRSS